MLLPGCRIYSPSGGSLTVVSATSAMAVSDGANATATVPSIPSGAVVVVTYTGWEAPTTGPSSTNLTFTQRVTQAQNGANAISRIYTAVAAGELTNEAISAAAVGDAPAITVFVLSGASVASLSTVGNNSGTTPAISVSVAGVPAGSYVLGSMYAYPPMTGGTVTPAVDITETFDGRDIPHANLHWSGRVTDPASGTVGLSGTIETAFSGGWSFTAIAISPA
jgi:hypothetical protein